MPESGKAVLCSSFGKEVFSKQETKHNRQNSAKTKFVYLGEENTGIKAESLEN
jgi:hypothetical protein